MMSNKYLRFVPNEVKMMLLRVGRGAITSIDEFSNKVYGFLLGCFNLYGYQYVAT